MRRSVLPGGQVMTDLRRLLSGVRLHRDGRLQFGGMGPAIGREREPAWRDTLARLRGIFPQLEASRMAFWWTGFMAMNTDNWLHVHELAPGLHAMMGCNGRGVALSNT